MRLGLWDEGSVKKDEIIIILFQKKFFNFDNKMLFYSYRQCLEPRLITRLLILLSEILQSLEFVLFLTHTLAANGVSTHFTTSLTLSAIPWKVSPTPSAHWSSKSVENYITGISRVSTCTDHMFGSFQDSTFRIQCYPRENYNN